MTPSLRRDEVELRPLAIEDARLVFDWRNQPRIRSAMFTTGPLEWSSHLSWIERTLSDPARGSFHILDGVLGPLGLVGFYNWSPTDRRAEWTIYVGSTMAPSGAGMMLGWLALDHFFGPLDYRKLSPLVLTSNARSVAFHQRLGFRHEGHLVRHVIRDDEPEDVDVFGMLEGDWLAVRGDLSASLFRS